MLSNEEKQLHKEVMIQNYDHMVSIGFIIPMEQLLQLIEKSDELPSNIMKEDVTKVQGDRHEITPTTSRWVPYTIPRQKSSSKDLLNSECIKSFPDKKTVTRCKAVHTRNQYQKCMESDGHFKQESEIKYLQTHEVNKFCRYSRCKKSFTLPFSLVTHRSTKTGEGIRDGPYSKQSRYTSRTLARIKKRDKHMHSPSTHKKALTGGALCKSGTCIKSFKKNYKPLQNVPRERACKCATYNKSFKHKACFVLCKKMHTGQKSYKCGTCGKRFSKKSILKDHEKIHTGLKQYKCFTCGKCFAWKSNFTVHERSHSGQKPYKCATCGKSFASKSNLSAHEKIHTGSKPFKCATCGKTFTMKCHLTVHERSHSEEKPYKCETCDKHFTTKGNLLDHEKIHTGNKPYKCTICDKSFAWKRYLRVHERIHSGLNKLYKCNICDKSFVRKGYVRVHERIHTGEKLYKCGMCDESFTWKKTFMIHKENHKEMQKIKT
ncbi:zinc finger protein 501-like isoform X2 [Protopterus annectens]|nr:zinc finger protein 501-like isoform X2 [Protopterus annectens]